MIIRWICEKCDKKWIYPVDKCVYCKGQITKQKGTKLKVIGLTKVAIPSPMHPIIPYNVLLLEDEHGNKMPRKTMKSYKIGDNFIQEKAKTDDAVSIIKVKYDIHEAVNEALDLLKDIKLRIDDKVLIKPSIIVPAYPYQAVATNPAFIDALLRILFDFGIKKDKILVAEQALIGSDVMDAASKAGIIEVCKKHDVEFADISKGPFEEVESESYIFKVLKEALKRKIINAPIMKTNFQLGISGAVENLSRLADIDTQRSMYYNDIDKTLPKLVNLFQDVLTIADATNGMQAQGPLSTGEPAFLNLVLASKNAANLDTAFCDITMLKVPAHVSAINHSISAKDIEVVGNELDALRYPIKAATPNETPHPDISVIDCKACPACLNLMYSLTSKLVGLRGEKITIVMGPISDESFPKDYNRLVFLGDCAIRRLEELKISTTAKIGENLDQIEQLTLLKKLLETKGVPKITSVDKVKSKMKKLLSKVIR